MTLRPNNILSKVFLLTLVGFISACSYHPTQHNVAIDIPSSFKIPSDTGVKLEPQPTSQWWNSFNTPELSTLLDELERNNHDLAISQLRINKARALANQQESRSWPELSLQSTYNNTKNHQTKDSQESGMVSFQAAYEIDLWGKRDAANSAANLSITLNEQIKQSLRLQLQSNFSQQYFAHLALKERLRIARLNLLTAEESLKLIKLKADIGSASETEFHHQKNFYLTQKSFIIALDRDLKTSERVLAVLLGRDGELSLTVGSNIQDISIPKVSIVQPATLLQTRPDIQMATSTLEIQDAVLFQTKTKRWPSLSLSADATVNGLVNGDAFWTNSLIGSLTQPLFNAGRIENQILAAESDVSISLIEYRSTVINAIKESLDSLSILNHNRQLFSVSRETLNTSKNLYASAKLTYEVGNTDFLSYLEAQRSWFSAQDSTVQAKLTYLTAIVNTFRAMGNPPQTQSATPTLTSLHNQHK